MTTRRSLITAAAGVGAGLTLGTGLSACSSSKSPSAYTADTKTLALAAAVENQLANVYDTMLATLRAGKAGTVTPAFGQFLATARAHHAEHAKTWNSLLRAAHKPEIAGVPLSGHAELQRQAAAETTLTALAALAARLEIQAARTHLASLGSLSGAAGISAAAGIAPIEAMHAAVVDCIVGGRPVPDDFLVADGAAHVSDLLV